MVQRTSSAWEVAEPQDLKALEDTVDRLLDRGVTAIAVAGGDGTLSHVVTRLLSSGQEPETLPLIWLLPCGTMNIVARCLGLPRRPWVCWDKICSVQAAGEGWHRFEQSTLAVEDRHGFIFGNGLSARFLEEYNRVAAESLHPSVARLLGKSLWSTLIGGRLSEALHQPYLGQVFCDGQAWDGDRWTAVVAGTVEQIGLGFRAFPRVREQEDVMQVVAIGTGLRGLAFELPRMRLGWSLAHSSNRSALCRHLQLRGQTRDYMLDGEIFESHSSEELIVKMGPPIGFGVLS